MDSGSRERQVPAQLSHLMGNIERLHPRLDSLRLALSGVLRPAGPTVAASTSDKISSRPAMAEAASQLYDAAMRIAEMQSVVDDILDRLEA